MARAVPVYRINATLDLTNTGETTVHDSSRQDHSDIFQKSEDDEVRTAFGSSSALIRHCNKFHSGGRPFPGVGS
jgi:hypothetical protein